MLSSYRSPASTGIQNGVSPYGHPGYEVFSPNEGGKLGQLPSPTSVRAANPELPNSALAQHQIYAGSTSTPTSKYTIVNVYRPPKEGKRHCPGHPPPLDPSMHCLIAGDFNTHYESWEANTAKTTAGVLSLIDWIDRHGLALISPADIATHSRGQTLDLAFSNIPGATTAVKRHLHTVSDHETLVTRLPH